MVFTEGRPTMWPIEGQSRAPRCKFTIVRFRWLRRMDKCRVHLLSGRAAEPRHVIAAITALRLHGLAPPRRAVTAGGEPMASSKSLRLDHQGTPRHGLAVSQPHEFVFVFKHCRRVTPSKLPARPIRRNRTMSVGYPGITLPRRRGGQSAGRSPPHG